MSKLIQVNIFNTLLDQLLEYLYNNFDFFRSDIMLVQTGIELIRPSNPRLVVDEFMSIAKLYRAQINDCNENFFINYEKNCIGIDNNNNQLLKKIKDIWKSGDITDVQKAHIWLFFQKLLKAGDKIV